MAKVQTNVGHRGMRTLTLDEFRGADFTSSVLDVDKRRAVSMKNLIPEAGRNVKRPGWQQVHQLEGRIHGMWTFSMGDMEELIVHAGANLYEVYEEEGRSKWRSVQGCTELLRDAESEAFFYGGRMYLVGHPFFLVYGSWDGGETYELRRVDDDEDTYIPTTTIGINAEGEVDEEGNVLNTRVSWDPVNRLSSKRKNRMMGKNEAGASWMLDSEVDWTEDMQECDVSVEVEVIVGGNPVIYQLKTGIVSDDAKMEAVLAFVSDEVPEGFTKGGIGGNVYMQRGGTKVTLNFKTTPLLIGVDNITVTFTKKVDGHAESIGECRFGILYGAGGNADRLFLSGNPDTPEIEYYSYFRDPTYFPDNHYNRVGTSYGAVTGFTRVSDGVLAVFKEGDRQEPTVYYHTASEEVVYNDADELERVDFILTTQAGNIGEAIVSRKASADFFGDPLILSKNGVFGIMMRQNLTTADRYAAERSRNIREKLKGLDMSGAVGVVFENKYWLFASGSCFVADEGYTFRPKENTSGYQYEWWYLDGIPAVSVAVMGNRLWFGTDDGKICSFRDRRDGGINLFTDETFRYFSPWVSPGVWQDTESLTVSADDFSKVVASETFMRKLGNAYEDTITLDSETYARYLNADEVTVEGGRIYLIDKDRIREVREGTEVYTDRLLGIGVSEKETLTITEIDRGDASFGLKSSSGGRPTLIDGFSFRLAAKLTGKELFVGDVDKENCTFSLKLYKEGEAVELLAYGSTGTISLFGKHTKRQTVAAEWYTPVVDLGTSAYAKTLERLTVSMEPMEGGSASVGYETRMTSEIGESAAQGGLGLSGVSFRDFSLTAFATSDTVLCRERNVNYIKFRVLSDTPRDMRVHGITAEYKITTANRGVR